MTERFALLGLARARSGWFQTVGQWATSALLPAEFVRCVSVGELRARLASGRPFSAALIAGDVPGLDRDLVAEARATGCAVVVVDDGAGRAWRDLGATAVLTVPFSRDELLKALADHVRPLTTGEVGTTTVVDEGAAAGRLVAVTGAGGTGASTIAVALAQGLARGDDSRRRRREARRRPMAVLLADLCRNADQAMLHDAGSVVPGLQEVVEAHRAGAPDPATVRDQTFAVPERGYRLLLGLRRPRHWVMLRPRAFEATLDTLQQPAGIVVADVDGDVEGEAETGSTDVEDRNLMARATLARADVVVVVGEPSMKGLHALVRLLIELLEFGVDAARIVPVLNRSPRRPRHRTELARSLRALVAGGADAEHAGLLTAPTFLPERRVDEALRDGVDVPAPLPGLVAGAVEEAFRRIGPMRRPDRAAPESIAPGSFLPFSAQDEGD